MTTLIDTAMDAIAEMSPESSVLKFSQTTLSYRELSRQSDRLASVLMEHGVRRGDRVGLYFNKSIESVVAIYGVMKAGAAYVPLDVGAPAARTRLVMDQCDIDVLISHPPRASTLAAFIECDGRDRLRCVIGIDEPQAGAAVTLSWEDVHHAGAFSRPHVKEDDLAYILFTSGSTGVPKGIMHTHQSGLAYANFAADTYEVRPGDRLSNHPPLHFDMSLFDYVSGPIRGACTVIIPEPHTRLPASLSKLIQDEKLTHWYSVPFALVQLLQYGALDQRNLSSLRWVVFAGEPFVAKHLRTLMLRLPNARFSNSYGPTETNQCTFHHITADDVADEQPPPIGQVWDGAETLVIDDNDREVQAGEKGELLVKSPTMMTGYWRRPDLNEKAFYTRWKATGPADIFYRTGDMVVEQASGLLRFLGRKDRQIKLRGFRIELDEVEAAIVRHPAVDEVAAILLKGENGHDGTILAVLTLKPGFDRAVADDIRAKAALRLPAYALPGQIDIVERLPRTATDKVDRQALARKVEQSRPAARHSA